MSNKSKKVFVSWSGGKDAMLSFYRINKNKEYDIVRLLNMCAEDGLRSRSHGIKTSLLHRQAESLGVPLVQRSASWGSYEDEFKKTLLELKKEGIETGVFGDIDLQEHRDWVERVCHENKITPILPIWHEDRRALIDEFMAAGFKATIVAVKVELMSQEWLGRDIDEAFIKDIESMGTVDLCGEKGEFHTFVYDGPVFSRPILIKKEQKTFRDERWFLELLSE